MEHDPIHRQLWAILSRLFTTPQASRYAQLQHSWNPLDRTPNIHLVDDDHLTCYRVDSMESSDCIRGKRGYNSGIQHWLITWPRVMRACYPTVGVATADAPMWCYGFKPLVGSNAHSWGWDLNSYKLYHNTQSEETVSTYPEPSVMSDVWASTGGGLNLLDKVVVILDMDLGTLSYSIDGHYLGVAFTDLAGRTLYPVVNIAGSPSQVTIRYLGGSQSAFRPDIALAELPTLQTSPAA